ncbi:hypothetical protein KA183_14095 [bacterium]|nr:hypothetical protein [bacterium]
MAGEEKNSEVVETKGDTTPPEQTIAQTSPDSQTEITLASNTLADVRTSLDILPDDMFKGANQRTQQGERLPQADSPEAIIRQLPYIGQHREKLDTLVKDMFKAFSPEGNAAGNMDQAKNSMAEILRLLPPEKRAMFGKWAKCLDQACRNEQNPETARQLKELSENLKVLEKAPGFMRGNLALAMYQWAGQGTNPEEIRTRLTEAQKAMQDTVQNYPALADDPNFRNRAQAIEQQYGAKLKTAAPATDGAEAHGGIMERVQKISQDIREGKLPLLYNPDAPQSTQPDVTNPVNPVVDKPVEPKPVDNPLAAIEKSEQAYAKYRQALVAELAKGTPLEVAAKAALTPEIARAFEESIAFADASAKPSGLANARLTQMLAAQSALEQQMKVEVDGKPMSWADANQGLRNSFEQYVGTLQLDPTQKGQLAQHIRGLDGAKSAQEYQARLQNMQQFLNSNQAFKAIATDSKLQQLLMVQQSLKTPMYPYLQQVQAAERMVQGEDSRAFNRLLYAAALSDAGQLDPAKKYLTDAYARSINTSVRAEVGSKAVQLGVPSTTLFEAALTRYENQPASEKDREPVPPLGELLYDMQGEFQLKANDLARLRNGDVKGATAETLKTYGPLFERISKIATANRARIEAMEQPLMADIKNQFVQILQGTGPKGQEILNLQQKVFGNLKDPAHINLLATMLSGDDATKARVKAELQRNYGDAYIRDFEQWRNLSGDKANLLFAQETRKTVFNIARNESQMVQFGAGRIYAQNLLTAGDLASAKTQLNQALKNAPDSVQGEAALSRDVQEMARQVGVDMTPYAAKIPSAPGRDQVILGQDKEVQRLQGVSQQTALDPRFANLKDNELFKKIGSLISKTPNGPLDADLTKQNIAELKPLYEEFIRRSESVPHPDNPSILVTPTVEQIFEGIKSKTDLLKAGVDPTTQRPLTEMQRVQLYREVLGSMEGVRNSILLRQQYGLALTVGGQMQDAERVLKEAKAMADKINRGLALEVMTMAQRDVNDPTVISNAPLETGENRGDVLRLSIARLQGDKPTSNFVNLHITTRVALGRFYMGPLTNGNDPTGGAILQYGNKAGIRPDLAVENLKEAKELTLTDRNVDILDKNKFLEDVDLTSALHLAGEILPSEMTKKLGLNESNRSLMVNALSAAVGIAWMRYTKGKFNEIPGLNPYTRLAGAVVLPTLTRNMTMSALGESESLFTSTRNAIGSTVAASLGYKMMIRGESSNFRLFEGVKLPAQVTSLPGRIQPYLPAFPKIPESITNRFSNIGRPMDNFGPLQSASFVDRMNHSVGTFAQFVRNEVGEKASNIWKPLQELAEAAGPNRKFSDLLSNKETVTRLPVKFETAASFNKLRDILAPAAEGKFGASLDDFLKTVKADPKLVDEIGKTQIDELEKLARRSNQVTIEVNEAGYRMTVPGPIAVEDAFVASGITHETLSTIASRAGFNRMSAAPLAERIGTIDLPVSGMQLRTMTDLKAFSKKVYDDLSQIQSTISSIEAKRRFGVIDNLNIEQALKQTVTDAAELTRLKATADWFGMTTRGELNAFMKKFAKSSDPATVLFPNAFKPGVGDDLVAASLKDPRFFDGPMKDYLLARIPKAELQTLQSAFYRQPIASDAQLFERGAFLNSGKTITTQSELQALYQNAFNGMTLMSNQIAKVTTAAADDTLETVFKTVPESGVTTEMIKQANAIGITNYGQLKSFLEKYSLKDATGSVSIPFEGTFNKLYPNLKYSNTSDIELGHALFNNSKALSGEGYSMMTASVSQVERQLLGTSSVISDTMSVNNSLLATRMAESNIYTISQFKESLAQTLKKTLQPLKNIDDFTTLSANQKSIADALGLTSKKQVQDFLANKAALPDVAFEKLFPRLSNLRGPGGEVLSKQSGLPYSLPIKREGDLFLADLAPRNPDMFSGPGLRLMAENAEFGFPVSLMGQRAQSVFNMPGYSRVQNAWTGVSNFGRDKVNTFGDWFRYTKLDPQTATLTQVARSQIAHSYYTGLGVIGAYRTLVTAPNNMEAGDNLAMALLHAHVPQTGDIGSTLLLSTPGAAIFMPLLVRGGYMPQQISVLQRFKDRGLTGSLFPFTNPAMDMTRQGLSRLANNSSIAGSPLAATLAFSAPIVGPGFAATVSAVASFDKEVIGALAQTGYRIFSKGNNIDPGEYRNMFVRTRDQGYQNLPMNGEYTSLEDYRRKNGIPAPEPQTVRPLERPAPATNDIYKIDTTQVVPRAALDAVEQQRLQAQPDVNQVGDPQWAPHIEAMRKVETAMMSVQQASYISRLNEAAVTMEALSSGQPVAGGAQQLARVAEVLQSIASVPEIAQNPANQALIASMGQVYQALNAAATSGNMNSFASVQDALKVVSENFKQHKLSDAQIVEMQTIATKALNEAKAVAAQYQQQGTVQANFLLSELGKADQNIKALSQSIFGQAVTYPEITPQMVMAKADNPQINLLRAELAKFESLQNMKNASAMLATQASVSLTNNVTVASLNPGDSPLGPNATPQDIQAFAAYQNFIAAISNRDLNASPEAKRLAQSVTPDVQRVIGNDATSNEILRLLQDAAGKGDTDSGYESLRAAAKLADQVDIGSLASRLVNNANPESQAALQMQAQLAGIAKLKYAQMAYRRQDYPEAQAYLIKARAQYGDQLEAMLQNNLDQGLDRNGFLQGSFTQMKKDANYDPGAMGNNLTSFFAALEKGNFGAKADDGTPGAQALLTQVKDAYNSKKQAVERALQPLNQQESVLKARLQALGVPYENRDTFLSGETNKTSEKYLQVESINRELKLIEASRNVRNEELKFDYNRMRLAEGLYDAAQGNYASANMILKEVKQNCPQLAAVKELDLDGKISITEPGMWGWTKRNWQSVAMFGAGLAATIGGALAFATVFGAVPGGVAVNVGVGLMAAAVTGSVVGGLVNGGINYAVTGDFWNPALAGAKEGALAGLIAPIGVAGKMLPLVPAITNPSVPRFIAGTYNALRPATYAIGAGATLSAYNTSQRWSEKSWGSAMTEFIGGTVMYSSMLHFAGSHINPLPHSWSKGLRIPINDVTVTEKILSSTPLAFRSNIPNALWAGVGYSTAFEGMRAAGDVINSTADSELVNAPYRWLTGSDLTSNRYMISTDGEGLLAPAMARFWTRDGLGLDSNNAKDRAWMWRNNTQIMRTGDSFYQLKQQGFNAQTFVPSNSYGPLLRR